MSDIDDIPRSIFLLGVHHAYAQTDGTYAWPNSREGDLLRQGMKEVEHLRAQLAAHVKENEALGKQQGEFIEEIVKLEQQRDEARREVCLWRCPKGSLCNDAIYARVKAIAAARGWDCFAQEEVPDAGT